MNKTEDQSREIFNKWIGSAVKQCHSCNQDPHKKDGKWILAFHTFNTADFGKDSVSTGGDTDKKVVSLECPNCGFIHLFSAKATGAYNL